MGGGGGGVISDRFLFALQPPVSAALDQRGDESVEVSEICATAK